MSQNKYGPYEWRRHKEFYEEKNGEIHFLENTPEEILESYRMYQAQIDDLEQFAKRPTRGLFAGIGSKKSETSDQMLGLAQRFVEGRNEARVFPSQWFHFDFEFHGVDGSVITDVAQFQNIEREYRISRVMSQDKRVLVFWKTEKQANVTEFIFKDDLIYKVREYQSAL